VLASARDVPADFAPAATLAGLYLALVRPAEALASADRALARAEGPRRVRVLLLRARAQRDLGDAPAAHASLGQAVREGEALPEPLRPRTALAQARKLVFTDRDTGSP